MSVIEKTVWHINEHPMPVEIHRERRRGWRYAFGKKNLIVRLPVINLTDEKILIHQIKTSLSEKMKKKPVLKQFFNGKIYGDGETITVGKLNYVLKFHSAEKKSSSAKLLNNSVIEFVFAENLLTEKKSEIAGILISRIVAQNALPQFSRRVHELNHIFFKKNVETISFKNNHSNWGSCSSKSNLNFSTRLLFAPDDVQDYVIIHELAHLTEMNHSDKFWKLVEQAMPDYEEKEKWLKKNSSVCRF